MILGFLTTNSNGLFNIPFSGLTCHFKLFPHTLYDNSFSYKFFDTIEKKKLETAEFIHHSRQIHGFEFQRILPPSGKENVSIRLYENNKKIQTVFMHDYKKNWYI